MNAAIVADGNRFNIIRGLCRVLGVIRNTCKAQRNIHINTRTGIHDLAQFKFILRVLEAAAPSPSVQQGQRRKRRDGNKLVVTGPLQLFLIKARL